MTPAEFKRVRELYGQTQEQFARELGLRGAYAARTVRAYELGEQPIRGPVARCAKLLLERLDRGKKRNLATAPLSTGWKA